MFRILRRPYIQHIIIILLLGLVVRIINPVYGSPILYVTGDEAPNYMGALYMMANKTILINTAIYPLLGSLVQIPFLALTFFIQLLLHQFSSFSQLKLFILTHEGAYLFVPRIISAFLGTATILVVYKITALLFPRLKNAPMLSALLFAFSFNHMQMSHSARPWTGAIFFMALSMYFMLKSTTTKRFNEYILAGVMGGLSYGFHQVGLFSIGFIVWFQLFKPGVIDLRNFQNRKFLSGIFTALIITGLFYFLHFNAPKTGFFRNSTDFPADFSAIQKITSVLIQNNLLYHIKEFIITEPVIFVFFCFAVFFRILKNHIHRTVLSYFLSIYILLSFSFPQPRYMLPVLLVMSLYGGFGLYFVLKKIGNLNAKLLLPSIIGMLFFLCGITVWWNCIYIKEPTFILARNWIDDHIPASDVILTTSLKFTGFTPAKNILSLQQHIHKDFYKTAGEMLQNDRYLDNVRNIIYLDKLANINVKENVPSLLENFPISFRYIIDMYWDPQDSRLLYLSKDKLIKRMSFSPLKTNMKRVPIENFVASVSDPPLPVLLGMIERGGPYVDIYEYKK